MKPSSLLTFGVTLCAGAMFAIALAPLRAGPAEPDLAQSPAIIDERLKQLSQQIEALQFDQQQMQKQVADLQAQVAELHRASGAASTNDLQALDAKIKASDAAREKDKQAILDAVAKEIAAISGRDSSSVIVVPAAEGKEYIVQKGDTLTSIAKTNRITIAQLKKANNLTTDTLQVGQKLVISKKTE
jgi:LysM repeat protein